MTKTLHVHLSTPQARLIQQVANNISSGAVIAAPTDCSYTLMTSIINSKAIEKIKKFRNLNNEHNFTLLCKNLSQIGLYAQLNDANFRLIKSLTPGAYVFILQTSKQTPKILQNYKKKTVGVRISGHEIIRAILEILDTPLLSTTLMLPNTHLPLTDISEIQQDTKGIVDIIIDSGDTASTAMSSVIDLTANSPKVIRSGKGDVFMFV